MNTTTKVTSRQGMEFPFTDKDVLNMDFIEMYAGEPNPHNHRMWLLHNHGTTLCVVLADSLQEALDLAADGGKLDCFLVNEEDALNYVVGNDAVLSYLGNASEPYDTEGLGWAEFPLPRRSLTALYGESIPCLSCYC